MAKELGDPLPDLHRHISLHGNVFRACAVVMQLTIKKGKPLYPVEYKDSFTTDFQLIHDLMRLEEEEGRDDRGMIIAMVR
jgi:hypothetical protein